MKESLMYPVCIEHMFCGTSGNIFVYVSFDSVNLQEGRGFVYRVNYCPGEK
jgi:hypothetical protein